MAGRAGQFLGFTYPGEVGSGKWGVGSGASYAEASAAERRRKLARPRHEDGVRTANCEHRNTEHSLFLMKKGLASAVGKGPTAPARPFAVCQRYRLKASVNL